MDAYICLLPCEERVIIRVPFMHTSKVLLGIGQQPAITITERLVDTVTSLRTQEKDSRTRKHLLANPPIEVFHETLSYNIGEGLKLKSNDPHSWKFSHLTFQLIFWDQGSCMHGDLSHLPLSAIISKIEVFADTCQRPKRKGQWAQCRGWSRWWRSRQDQFQSWWAPLSAVLTISLHSSEWTKKHQKLLPLN